MITFKETYDLPDYSVTESTKDFDFQVWKPDSFYVVLGRSDTFEKAVNTKYDFHSDMTVVKRPSGGHSVVVSPKTLVISAIFRNTNIKSKEIFKLMNAQIIENLNHSGMNNLNEKGISDISVGNKKILGSSIYKKPEYTFYHAVLNHSEDIELIQKLLQHPKREPDYRKGRSHKEFVTSLTNAGYTLSVNQLATNLKIKLSEFEKNLRYH